MNTQDLSKLGYREIDQLADLLKLYAQNPNGFLNNGHRIYYMDYCGKDSGFNRWRIYGYYESHKAETIFFNSESEYNEFIKINNTFCYSDFADFDKKFNPNKNA
jgi:hypothetical protein